MGIKTTDWPLLGKERLTNWAEVGFLERFKDSSNKSKDRRLIGAWGITSDHVRSLCS